MTPGACLSCRNPALPYRQTCLPCTQVLYKAEKGLRFTGVDGEGITTCASCRAPLPADIRDDIPVCACGESEWRHDYVLLTIGDEEPLVSDERLQWYEVFAHLHAYQETSPNVAMVGFYLGYDFTHWMRTLPEERARMLLSSEGQVKRKRLKSGANTVPFPVYITDPDGMEWEFDFLPGRRFKVRPVGHAVWAYVCDTGPYWQSSLLAAINPKTWPNPVCSDNEYAMILEGKARRGSAILDREMMEYNAMENRILSRITKELDAAFRKAGITLQRQQWFGPGQVAQKWLTNQKLITSEKAAEKIPSEFWGAAARTYYGGWFMIALHGIIAWLEEWDINSAYPYAMTKLPCLEHGVFSEGAGFPLPVSPWVIVECDISSDDENIGAGLMCRRKDGSIHTPKRVRGWYWLHEISAAMEATGTSWDKVRAGRWWAYDPCACRPPLRALEGLYEERLRVGKNTPEGKALKLIYNSCYGKLAQTVGLPKYSNPVYASLITSLCRTMILQAIASHPEGSRAVAMVATDGVYFTSEHPGMTAEEEKLGEWDRKAKTNVTLFKPGVYWDDAAREAIKGGALSVPLKSRGVNAKALAKHIDEIDSQFEAMKTETGAAWPEVKIPIPFQIVTPALALARGKWHTCGRILLNQPRDESSDPTSKRHPTPYVDENGNLRTHVHNDGITHEYVKLTPDAQPLDLDGTDGATWFREWTHTGQ